MAIRLPRRRSLGWRGGDTWPLLLLLVAVLVPTGLLLWFMSDAVARQSAAARQTTLGAYRGQLRLLRDRTDVFAQPYASRLERELAPGESSATSSAVGLRFARLVLDERLDGAVLFDEAGRAEFPSLVSDRRLAAGDRQLLSVQRLASTDRARSTELERLASLLNDYQVAMPSPQRLFLMGELRRMAPHIQLPTDDALRLSTQVLEAGEFPRDAGVFRPTPTDDVWALTSTNRRVIGLYRTKHLQTLIEAALRALAPRGIQFRAYPPSAGTDAEAIAAGPALPGWQLSFVVLDSAAIDAAMSGRVVYLWVGFAGIITVAVLGVVVGQIVSRRLRLARLKADLTAAVSHELRAPLASVRVLIEGLLADRELDATKTREYLHLIAGEHQRLSRVIEHFLTFARLERTRARFALVRTQPADVVAASLDAIRERTPEDCHLRVEVAENLPSIMADPGALATALGNLLDNALKFTPDEKQILLRAYADGGSVLFAVQDNGRGIPAHEQRRIFQSFYRIDQCLTRETDGVGLGLSIVDLIVRAHGGRVEVASVPGAGSTFAVRLPAREGGRA